jgi:hypothetical protein
MKEAEYRETGPVEIDWNPLLDAIIQAAQDPEIQKDFKAWEKAQRNRKIYPSHQKARHLYLESDLEKGLGE